MRVLLADDDAGVLMALEMLLHREGIETARAASPAEVLEQLGRAPAEGSATGPSAGSGAAPFGAVLLDLNYTV